MQIFALIVFCYHYGRGESSVFMVVNTALSYYLVCTACFCVVAPALHLKKLDLVHPRTFNKLD